MAKNAVQKKDDAGVPAYLADQQVDNRDNFDQTDIVIPRIKLLQALSTECETFNDARPGHFWHTGFDRDLGEQVDFVVASRRKKLLLVAPMEDGQGILARSEDFRTWDRLGSWQVKIKGVKQPVTWEIDNLDVAKSGLDKWGTYNPGDENSPPAATLFYEYLVLLPEHPDLSPVVLSLTRSAIRKAKKGLNDKIDLQAKSSNKIPQQALVFRATAGDDKNSDGQSFKNWTFMMNGFAPKDVFDAAVGLKDTMTSYSVQGEEDVVNEESRGGRKDGDNEEY